ncbi:AAA family ATPase [Pseudomonas entomophila]|uniref:AAA family ATPase n=1 Tax=Pseudomonas entomophila TaxID=312306 RepID=UPI003EBCDC02
MDRLSNPFSPGAGAPPPELAGRDEIIENAKVALHRIRKGRPEKSQMLLGLRGVGKTVLLNKISDVAEGLGYHVVMLEAPEDQRLANFLAPALKAVLIRLSKIAGAKALAENAIHALRGFASAFKVSIGEVEIGVAEVPTADSGNLEVDLPELLLAVGAAAKAAGSSVAILVDEVQYLSQEDLRALIVALHRISQKSLPLVLFGAGLPQVAALAGDAKSYAERLFDYPGIGPLKTEAVAVAIREPISDEHAEIEEDAIQQIANVTQGYPYFIQEWGKHSWNVALASPITKADVDKAGTAATEALDRSFFRVRFDRLTPREQDYLRAMAELGAGPHRSGLIADMLGSTVERMGPLRSGLIKKGMIWSPAHGDTAFTVPMFDAFMIRAIPQWSRAQNSKPKKKK